MSNRPFVCVNVTLYAFVFAMLGFAQNAAAQTDPLHYDNNFLVTGDYVVAGAYGMTTTFTLINGNSYAVGNIYVPDMNPATQPPTPNPGITGQTQVPTGAQIVAALLYWQTVEKVGVTPGGPGSGQVGYFRPLLYGNNGPAVPGYSISGTDLSVGSPPVSWSNGGCSGTSTGKVLKTYRADVSAYLPQDVNGNVLANGQYEVRMPSIGNQTPLTLGATLVIVYRVLSPDVPLNAIVIYDGDFSAIGGGVTTSQTVRGFYDAGGINQVSRLTHIVGSGQPNKYQTVYVGSQTATGSPNMVQLPSLYGGPAAFPGYYGSWDNPTWTFPGNPNGNPNYSNLGNPMQQDAVSAITQVIPTTSNQGCVSWGAVIVSTTVQHSDNDGILDAWKANQGYCDAAVNNGACTVGDTTSGWVPLTGATHGQKDVFLQLDYLCGNVSNGQCQQGGDNFNPYQFKDSADGKTAVQKVIDAYASSPTTGSPIPGINLHVIPGNIIQEQTCTDSTLPLQCPYQGLPGVVWWKAGLSYLLNQPIDPSTGKLCSSGQGGCVPVFQHGKKDSYHYALFANSLGLPDWSVQSGTLQTVQQIGNMVTFTTSNSVPSLGNIVPDAVCPAYGRVTVAYATTDPTLNGTYCVQQLTQPSLPGTLGSFSIQVTNSTATPTYYTLYTDPNLAVASSVAGTISGFSDVGGADSLITLGSWGPDGQTWQTNAGTLMHELGHTEALTHGGFDLKNPAGNDYTATVEPNCKSNFQSVMNYLFQVDLLDLGKVDANGNPLMAVDYSRQLLNTLDETTTGVAGNVFLSPPTLYPMTSWYALTSSVGGTAATQHCDGTPLLSTDPSMTRVAGTTSSFAWTLNQDINFDGNSSEALLGHNDWNGTSTTPGIDLRQVSVGGTLAVAGTTPQNGGGGATKPIGGGGGATKPIGGGGGATKPIGGGGGATKPIGGGGGVPEINRAVANSVTRPPRNLKASEDPSPRHIVLSWTVPTFGQIGAYNIYRSTDGGKTFSYLTSVLGSQVSFPDTVTCNTTGYQYYVTAVLAGTFAAPLPTGPKQGQESVPSNTVSVPSNTTFNNVLLTACYTNSPPTVVLNNLSFPTTAVKRGTLIPITWTLQDDNNSVYVNNKSANSLVAIGPTTYTNSTNTCAAYTSTTPATTLLSNGTQSHGTFVVSATSPYQFTFTWNTTGSSSGCYFFKLTVDSTQVETSTSAVPLK